ncbi:unnamed protein product [Rhizophagus irregularis]|nr:unnamed protein product [Rhizophagus irregularis]
MPSKISTIFYIHDSNERLMQEYTVKEIMAVSRISRLRLKILKGGCDMFKGEICSLRRINVTSIKVRTLIRCLQWV